MKTTVFEDPKVHGVAGVIPASPSVPRLVAAELRGGKPAAGRFLAAGFLAAGFLAAGLTLGATTAGTARAGEPAAFDAPIDRGLAAWEQKSGGEWALADDVTLREGRPDKLDHVPGKAILVNGKEGVTSDIWTKKEYGDVEAHVEFLVPRGSNSGVYFMGRYEIQVLDSWDPDPKVDAPKANPTYSDCGGIYQRWKPERGAGKEGFEGHGPRVNACKRPGEWQSFDVVFVAPRFDAGGKRVSPAKFVRVIHNGIVVHENVEVSGPTRAAKWEDEKLEKPAGPLMLQGDHGPVAYRNIRIRPLVEGEAEKLGADFPRELLDDSGFVAIFDGKTLAGWHVSAKTGHSGASGHKSGGRWVVEDEAIVGSQDIPGNGGIIITDREYGDFEVALQMRNDFGPDSGLFLRSTESGAAYQYLVDYHNDGNLAGLYGEGISPGFVFRNFLFLDDVARIKPVQCHFPLPVKPQDWPRFWKHGEWNELRARIEGNPPMLTTWINGVRFMEWKDPERRHPDRGGIALQVHGGGDLTKQFVRYRKIRIKELGKSR